VAKKPEAVYAEKTDEDREGLGRRESEPRPMEALELSRSFLQDRDRVDGGPLDEKDRVARPVEEHRDESVGDDEQKAGEDPGACRPMRHERRAEAVVFVLATSGRAVVLIPMGVACEP
jgi:hypothetical protein